jgi:hypothetical protein
MREDFLKRTNQKHMFAITSAPDTALFVRYLKENTLAPPNVHTIFKNSFRKYYGIKNIITFHKRYAYFYKDGVVINPSSINVEGYFGLNRVGNQLPNDFEPTK